MKERQAMLGSMPQRKGEGRKLEGGKKNDPHMVG
jgi:hypothetical protein